jgi:hypothetical protein
MPVEDPSFDNADRVGPDIEVKNLAINREL